MERTVPIDAIVVNRPLEPGDDITELAASIERDGQQIPILVNQNYELIDGLRRLMALRSLGYTEADIVPVTMFLPATSWIERARLHGVAARPLTPRRVWYLYNACLPLISVSRSHEMKGKRHGKGVRVNGRENFLKATGIASEAYLQAALQTYRQAQEQGTRGELARQAVELIERGKLSVYGAVEWVKRRYNEGDITTAAEQLTVLQNTTNMLSGITFGLRQLGPLSDDVTREQIEPILKDLRKFRTTIHQLIHTLDREKGS